MTLKPDAEAVYLVTLPHRVSFEKPHAVRRRQLLVRLLLLGLRNFLAKHLFESS